MSLHTRIQAFIVCWLLSFSCWAMEPLPRPELSSINTAIRKPFEGLLNDYLELLPQQTSLSYFGEDFVSHSWSKNREELSGMCRTMPAACSPLLNAQFDLLTQEWQKRDAKQKLTLRDVVVMSAVSDLCDLAGSLVGVVDMGYRCQSKWNIAAWAAFGWFSLGYDHLFLAYLEIDLAERGLRQYWLEHDSKFPPAKLADALKSLDRGKGVEERDAYALELRDSPSGAFTSWLMSLLQSISPPNPQGMLLAMENLARLSALQDKMEQAEQWWQLSESLIAEHPELKQQATCLQQSNRFLIDVEQARSTQSMFDGVPRIQNLIDHGCPYSGPAFQFALFAIKQLQPAQALDVLQRAQAACETGADCRYDRLKQIKSLRAVAQGQLATFKSDAQNWQVEIKHRILLGNERQIVWTLADRLRDAGANVEAAALYRALDEQIELSRNQTTTTNSTNLARYDELKRMRVRNDVEQKTQILPMQSESLRGQSLLNRLRTQRWSKELSVEVDAEAKNELERQLAVISNFKKALTSLLPDASPFIKTVVNATLRDMEDAEQFQREVYLGKLAAKKLNTPGFLSSTALMSYGFYENFSLFNSPISALNKNEAYLSWLRVPGGYIGTLLAVTPRDISHRVLPTQHSIKQSFISFSPQDEALLQLYHDLLQSGASVSRGAKLSAPIEVDKAGLMLNGLPIWQQTDGSFIINRTAPAGALRIKNFGNLSDALFERLLAPFAEQYQDSQRLIISPDGALSYLPFETLTRQGVSVLETIDIGYIQSLAVYAELKKRSAANKSKSVPSLLSVADPQYGAKSSGADDSASGSLRRMRGISWPDLPGTRAESLAIAKLYRNKRQLLGAQASKTTLDKMQGQGALKDFQILHFATHGYVDDERSALVLTPEKSSVSAYLMDQDIVSWNLDSDLVLLSACNTGVGRQQTGEGIVGLPYAFFMAGNINTLMSLWPVDDEGTAKLMPTFMQRIQKGEDHITALNNTKRAFARGEFGEAFSNPRVWSAFVMYGVPLSSEEK